ncbi:MCP four helix bundle domain-containing protein [Geomonas subterranea]|uniref:MCP four helix bundle domain-containing protein n=1 Tax=Geomonas subterranea TaxID=2847989 RepID=A0ABX8LD29_9BACT|nr:methyl-accepting chemotaxis protein [Geomonas subterranea]QXE89329.1 MCP four helix bundle domain-containing protein [Geomonas subterranea]QXM08556.1 MCP four helix bundle domain-containing protein [Geomonas subterranea]
MTVKSKLWGNIALTIVGISVLAGIGLFSIAKVKSSIEILTGKSTPLHLKMLELQQTVEKVSADFMRLEMTTEPAEVAHLSQAITTRIKRMEELNDQIVQGGAASSGVDTAVLRDIEKTVVQVASQRLKDMTLFKNEIATVNSELRKAEESVAGLRKQISQMGSSALSNINSSQAANLQVNSSIKKLLTLQSRLKDINIILSDLELVKNKFKVAPLRERLKNTVELTRNIEVDQGDNPAIKEVKGVATDILNQIGAEEGGLVSLKLEMLTNPEKADAEQYAGKARDIMKPLEENSKKIFNTIDTLELQIVKDRNKVVSSLGFQNSANSVMEAGSNISVDVKELNSGVRQIMLSSTDAEVGRLTATLAETRRRIDGNIALARKVLLDSGQKELAERISDVSATVRRASSSIQKIEATKLGVIRSNGAMQRALESARGISREQAQRSEEQVKSIGENQQQILTGVRNAVDNATLLSYVMIAVSVAVVLISLVISLRIIASITKPLSHAKLVTADIAGGDLTRRIRGGSNDEIGDICDSINNIVVHFHEVISRVSHNTTQVASTSTELSCAAEQMAAGAARVAEQAATVATASEEMAATSNDIAVSCTQAAAGSKQANDAAVTGADVVKGTVRGMNQIAEQVRASAVSIGDLGQKSEQIGAIVNTINDIADQTNLLALNAAIEAARAGEQGRGFAVVADEVRALAQRTASATREIGEMIKAVQQQTKGAIGVMQSGVARVEAGTVEAARSGAALEEILQQIGSVTLQVNQIATAAEEQTATTVEISNNIQSINEVVQDTAKNAQESASSALLLSRLAEEQQKLVGQFKLSE